MNVRSVLLTVIISLAPLNPAAASAQITGCPSFPADNIWNTPVNNLPKATNSAAYIATIGGGTTLHPDFGAPYMESGRLQPIGIPFNIVSSSQPKKTVHFQYDSESDRGPYPIPVNPAIEGVLPSGDQNADGDRHILMVDKDSCILYELYYAWPRQNGSWDAGSGAIFNLKSNDLRPAGWTSADAAGLPILPGLVRYDEILAGEINHAIRFTARNNHIRNAYVWPARHRANTSLSAALPPMGQRFRLKSGFNIAGFSTAMKIILKAMKTYGLILADNGSDWYISGTSDSRWDNDTLVNEFRRLRGENFEAVDVSSLMVSSSTGQVKSTTTTGGGAKPANTGSKNAPGAASSGHHSWSSLLLD